jgi:hypothetical protein
MARISEEEDEEEEEEDGEDGGEEEDDVLDGEVDELAEDDSAGPPRKHRRPAAPAVDYKPSKRGRVTSAAFVEDSDEEDDDDPLDDLQAGGLNPYPCSNCVQKNIPCQWLADTTRKSCRLCSQRKIRCSTIEKNRDALYALRKSLKKKGGAAPRSHQVEQVVHVKPPPSKKQAKTDPFLEPAELSKIVDAAVAAAVEAAAVAIDNQIDEQGQVWQGKLQGKGL